MKILSINPGHTALISGQWKYSIVYELSHAKQERYSKEDYPSATAAKQAMREKVAQERKKHCI